MSFRNYGFFRKWLDRCLKETRFRAPFDSQHVKECQTLLKYVQKHFVKCLAQ